MQIEETADKKAEATDFIETKYIGETSRFEGTTGEAYFNANSNSWHYRPYKDKVVVEFGEEKPGFFIEVSPKEIECASDKGWLKGNYVGTKDFPKQGKAYWVDGCWNYKPAGTQKEYRIPEGKFIPVRDVDIYEGSDKL